MTVDTKKILRKLDRKILVDWIAEMKAGRPVYDWLLVSLAGNELNRNQRANALVALFRLKGHGSDEEVYRVFLRYASDPDIRVRTQAVSLLIGMSRLNDHYPSFSPPDCREEILRALEMGLYVDGVARAREFLGLESKL